MMSRSAVLSRETFQKEKLPLTAVLPAKTSRLALDPLLAIISRLCRLPDTDRNPENIATLI